MPPAPPRSGSTIVAIVLLVLALIVVVSVGAVWTGLRFLSSNVQIQTNDSGSGKKEVSIKTPFGGLEVLKNPEVTEATVQLPIYPGSRPVKDDHSANVNIGLPNNDGVQIVAGKFETDDPIDKVVDFYKDRLGTQVTKFTQKDSEGKTVFEIKEHENERVVALKSLDTGTQIDLVRVTHGQPEVN